MNDLTPESTVVMVPKSVRRGLGRATVVSITPSNVAKLLIWDFKWALVHRSDIRQQLCRRRKSGFRVKRVFFFLLHNSAVHSKKAVQSDQRFLL